MPNTATNAYLVGGGIASLATAVFLLRDAGYPGHCIHIFERSSVLGGSLDASGSADEGYVIRGGRMFEAHFGCTYNLLATIPSLENPDVSVTQDIRAFTQQIVTSSSCRLLKNGERIEAPLFELSVRDRWDLARLCLRRESSLGGMTIEQYFSPGFFSSNFWIMWCTMFAFRSWHSVSEFRRYMRRFMHLLPGFNRLEGIFRTRLNQYDTIVRPIVSYLREQGVHIHLQSPVTAIGFDRTGQVVKQLSILQEDQRIEVQPQDRVFITLGSMTEACSFGSTASAPRLPANRSVPGSWALWRQIASTRSDFGSPDDFAGDLDKSMWESFTVTLRDPAFFAFMERLTGNAAGTGGLVTFRDSGWLLSIVLAHQPHFSNQEEDVFVFWGYGLHPEKQGDGVHKSMLDCSGEEILQELGHQLAKYPEAEDALANAVCIPCVMPYITAQFMPRTKRSRPKVIPDQAENFAFIGQFCELPEDTVFTVEYSVRSAQTAVYGLCTTDKKVTPLYRGFLHPRVVANALASIARNGAA